MLIEKVQNATTTATGAPFPIRNIELIDQKSICDRVANRHDLRIEEVQSAFSDLLVFLSASVSYPDATFSPPPILDYVWHEFILHTNAYLNFCRDLGVFYIHHIPKGSSHYRESRENAISLEFVLDGIGVEYNRSFWASEQRNCNGCDRGIQQFAVLADQHLQN